MTSPLLQLEGLTRRFGGLLALDDVGFSVGNGDLVGLIGAAFELRTDAPLR